MTSTRSPGSRLAPAHRVHGDRHRLSECGCVLEQSERFRLDASAGGQRTELGEASVALQPDSGVAVAQVRPTFAAVAAHGTCDPATAGDEIALGEAGHPVAQGDDASRRPRGRG